MKGAMPFGIAQKPFPHLFTLDYRNIRCFCSALCNNSIGFSGFNRKLIRSGGINSRFIQINIFFGRSDSVTARINFLVSAVCSGDQCSRNQHKIRCCRRPCRTNCAENARDFRRSFTENAGVIQNRRIDTDVLCVVDLYRLHAAKLNRPSEVKAVAADLVGGIRRIRVDRSTVLDARHGGHVGIAERIVRIGVAGMLVTPVNFSVVSVYSVI